MIAIRSMSTGKKVLAVVAAVALAFVVLVAVAVVAAPDQPEDLTGNWYTEPGSEWAGPRAALEEVDVRDDSIAGLVIECETTGVWVYLQRTWDVPPIFDSTSRVQVRWAAGGAAEGLPQRWYRIVDHEKTVWVVPREIGEEMLSALKAEPSSLSITTLPGRESGSKYITYNFESRGFNEAVVPMLDECGYQWQQP